MSERQDVHLPENEHSHDDNKHKESELLIAAAQGEGEGLQASDVTGQLEDPADDVDKEEKLSDPPENPHDTEDLSYPSHLTLILRLGPPDLSLLPPSVGDEGEDEGHKVRQDAQQVHYVHRSLHKPAQGSIYPLFHEKM